MGEKFRPALNTQFAVQIVPVKIQVDWMAGVHTPLLAALKTNNAEREFLKTVIGYGPRQYNEFPLQQGKMRFCGTQTAVRRRSVNSPVMRSASVYFYITILELFGNFSF